MTPAESEAIILGLKLIDVGYSRAASRLPGAHQAEQTAREQALVELSDEQLMSLIREGAEHLDALNHKKETAK
jgi:hypothetical protein